ncbi:6-phospho-3-hexuloisomerase [Metabacillus niabensis]|uniref:6-phospho-3-hexuloisomerase n=1 Tax=Metabacillus niabensis TaxID=324854 RepID=UPI001CFBE5B2|nr:6-phospho-3-hexuloisomerase [Metabacillus niabensis]
MEQLKSLMVEELKVAFSSIKDTDIQVFIKEIIKARKIFLFGLGRERLMLQAFAMRLMHLGLDVHVVGDVTAQRIQKNDLFITSSGTGYLSTVEALLKIVKQEFARVVFITASDESPLLQYIDHVVQIDAQTMKVDIQNRTSPQPMGAVFEQAQLLLFELIIVRLKEELSVSEEKMEVYHTNLE